jgi:uncharacterized membrane protein
VRRPATKEQPLIADEHTIHRLEAFSDIVMGFCLAQLGLNLVLPRSAGDLESVWASSMFFILAFFFIALLWWLHHRTFSVYFVLNTPMVAMNFAMLGGLILTLYFFESILHVASAGQNPRVFFSLFVFAFAFVYLLLGMMLLVGLLTRRASLPSAEIRWGIGQLASVAMGVLFFLVAGTFVLVSAHASEIKYAAIAMGLLVFVVRRLVLPRWLLQRIPG